MKDACINNKALCDIIDKNLYALKSIDNVIDEDLKNNLMIFNHNLSEDLKTKLLDINTCYMPLRDKKFEEILNDLTCNKVKIKFLFVFIFLFIYFYSTSISPAKII